MNVNKTASRKTGMKMFTPNNNEEFVDLKFDRTICGFAYSIVQCVTVAGKINENRRRKLVWQIRAKASRQLVESRALLLLLPLLLLLQVEKICCLWAPPPAESCAFP